MGPLKLVAKLALVLIATITAARAQEPTWPIGNGRHDILHSFQNPFNFSGAGYFHEGVDHRGSLDDVLAVRGGIVRYISQGDSGGTLLVEVQTPSGVEADSYLHIYIDPWTVGQTIQAGDRVGRIHNNYFATILQDHVHVNRFRGWAGGSGYITGRSNMLNPMLLYGLAPNRDPQELQATLQDANADGYVFHVAPSGQPATRLPFAFGSAELYLEATDRLSNTLSWNQGLYSVGYWIESRSGGDSVASAGQPYRLMRFDDAWRESHPNCDSLLSSVMLNAGAYRVQYGSDNTGWYSLATYRLTRAGGFTGLASDLVTPQFWLTTARVGSGSQNGTGAAIAREIHEARFLDGHHRVHAFTEDVLGVRNHQFDVMVDNFRPYLKSVRMFDLRSGNELYRSGWAYDAVANRLNFSSSFPSGSYAVRSSDELRIELEFSEPMTSVSIIQFMPSIGSLPVLRSIQPKGHRTTWTGKLTIGVLPAGVVAPRIWVSGSDLAGTTLYPHWSRESVVPPFNRRVNANPMTVPTLDTAHILPLIVTSSDLQDQ